MTRASGFTLLEVMVAIVLTSLVVLLAYGAARVSYDAHARLSADLRALQDLDVIAVDFSFAGDTAEVVIANMRRFREDVLSKV